MTVLSNLVTMPRFNRGMALRPVHRIKHVIDSQQGMVLGTQLDVTLVFSVDAPVLANTTEVETGSKVNGIYLKVEITATSGTALANAYLMVYKNPGNNTTAPAANVVGASDNKRFSIHQEMVMLQKFDADVSANPRILFNGVITIPRGYRRFGPGDRLQLLLLTPGSNADVCIQCHYKEFR